MLEQVGPVLLTSRTTGEGARTRRCSYPPHRIADLSAGRHRGSTPGGGQRLVSPPNRRTNECETDAESLNLRRHPQFSAWISTNSRRFDNPGLDMTQGTAD